MSAVTPITTKPATRHDGRNGPITTECTAADKAAPCPRNIASIECPTGGDRRNVSLRYVARSAKAATAIRIVGRWGGGRDVGCVRRRRRRRYVGRWAEGIRYAAPTGRPGRAPNDSNRLPLPFAAKHAPLECRRVLIVTAGAALAVAEIEVGLKDRIASRLSVGTH
jgi:hypothetical protein